MKPSANETRRASFLVELPTSIAIPLNNTSFPRRRESSQNGGHEWWFIARRLAFTLAGYQPSLV
jgi:hypothetical protein